MSTAQAQAIACPKPDLRHACNTFSQRYARSAGDRAFGMGPLVSYILCLDDALLTCARNENKSRQHRLRPEPTTQTATNHWLSPSSSCTCAGSLLGRYLCSCSPDSTYPLPPAETPGEPILLISCLPPSLVRDAPYCQCCLLVGKDRWDRAHFQSQVHTQVHSSACVMQTQCLYIHPGRACAHWDWSQIWECYETR